MMSPESSSRRLFLRASSGLLMAGACGVPSRGEGPADPASDRGRRFLASLFDPSVGLLPEYPGSSVYWLYHDNYLAAKVLEATEPALAAKIREAIRGFGVTRSGKIEILFGESDKPLPFRHYRLEEVRRVGPKIIRTEVVGDKVHGDWATYTDLLFLAAIAESGPNPEQARQHFDAGMRTWNGQGIRDRASQKNGLYASYKLALALIAGQKLGLPAADRLTMRDRLLTLQRQDGGFITDYNEQGKPVGQANVETTSLALLALAG